MAAIFGDGFDHYTTDLLLQKWSNVANWTPAAVSTADGCHPAWARPPGGQGLRLSGGNHLVNKVLGANYATLIFGANVYFESVTNGGVIAAFMDGSTIQVDVRTDATGHLIVSRNGTTLAVSANALSLNTWYHIEFKATIHNTAGTYEVRVNGSSSGWIEPTTGANTRATGNNFANQFQLGPVGGNAMRYDDLYLLDTSGSVNNDFIGPQKCYTSYPSGAGTNAGWSGNYADNFANVNERIADGDVTVNQTSAVGSIDSFPFDQLPAGTVAFIQHVIQARQDAGTARQIASFELSGGTGYAGSGRTLAGSHLFYLEPKNTDPATGAAWTVAGFNGAEFGYKLVA